MHDYRLLMPALVFWAVRVGWISPLQTVLLISIAVLILAYLAYTGIGRECLAQTVAGMVFAAVIAIAVGLILPLPEKSSRYGANNLLPKECNASIFQGESIYAHAENFRCIIHTQFRMLGADFSDQTAGILRGVVLGDATGLPADLRNQVKLAGLQHLVAISGAHISLLIGVAMILLGRRRRRLTAMIASIFLFLLVGLVGLSASVLRAAIMGIVALIAFSLGRGSGVIAALSLGVIVGAAFWPDLAAGIGFQMSVITTGAIIVIGNSFLQIPAIVNRRWATWLVIPLIAGTAIIPISAQLQPQLSLFAVPANIVVAPVIPVITVLGLAAAVIGAFIPAIAAILLFPCAIGAWWVSQVVRFSTMFTAFIFPVWVVAVIQLGGLILLLLWARKQSVRDSAKIEFARQGWPRFWSWPYFIIAGVVICILLIFPLMPVIIGNKTSFAWEFIQCDVGQGSGLLARNGGKTVLIDTGKERSNAVPCLRRHKIRKLDLLIISHLDADHVGGFEQVLAEVQVEQVWLSENQHPQYRHKQVLAAAQKKKFQ
ncbi:ComEC/Rec2 family competence protein [Arcanobacterium hippocoleae]|uniref:ComEC/Rec2 family competence protein n=1 Tax=Arcanobacterium hippocoleae TaxID=149017 RepID=UPI00334056A6